jgi:hypothetical protein
MVTKMELFLGGFYRGELRVMRVKNSLILYGLQKFREGVGEVEPPTNKPLCL